MEHILVVEARKYIGVSFFYKGRGKGGMDCAGLVCVSLSNTIIPGYNFLNYTLNPSPKDIRAELLSIADDVREPISGDLMIFSLSGLPQHVAIYTNSNTIIHTYKRVGKVIEEKYTNYWKSKLENIYRVRS